MLLGNTMNVFNKILKDAKNMEPYGIQTVLKVSMLLVVVFAHLIVLME